jgi:hypothetical protein
MADPAATKPKTKRTKKPLTYQLLASETVKSLLERASDLPTATVVYVAVPPPNTVRKDKPRRDDYKRGVKAALEAGENIEVYNDRALVVGSFGDTFRFKAEVEEVTVRKVKVSEDGK